MFPAAKVTEANGMSWKSGNVVRLPSGGEAMKVVGTDSVGSVICRPLGRGNDIDIYLPPSLLVAADPEPDANSSEHPTPSAAESE